MTIAERRTTHYCALKWALLSNHIQPSPPFSRWFVQGMAAFMNKPAVLDALKGVTRAGGAERKRLGRLCSELAREAPEGALEVKEEAKVRSLATACS